MGLFQHRPEEPTEWAGLPSEPADPESPAERLPDAGEVAISLGALLGREGTTAESIVIPVDTTDQPEKGPGSAQS